MADEEHLKIIRQGAAAWNDWREENDELIYPDLSRANLSGAPLIKTDLRDATLTESSVYGVSVWDIKVNDRTKQQNLIITASG